MIRKLSAAILLASAVAPTSLYALGLGELHTRSGLNQAFNADIDLLSVDKGEVGDIKVKLASPQAFSRAGVDRPYALSQLRFKPRILPNGKAVIHITSKDPVREPFLDFLVEVDWPSGRLVREYTVLLDPPVTLARRPAPVHKARATGKTAPRKSEVAATKPARHAAPVAGDRYGPVRRGDTLWGIAQRTRYPDVSVEQMALAYFDTNQHAFTNGDINKLKRGAELTIPSHDKASELPPRKARQQFFAEANAHRAATEQRVAANVKAPAATAGEEPEAKLVISATRPEGVGEAGLDSGDAGAAIARVKQELLLAREENAEVKLENEGLRNHITELEEQLAKLTRLVTLKNEQLAKIQAAQLGLEEQRATEGEPPSVIDQAIEAKRNAETAASGEQAGETETATSESKVGEAAGEATEAQSPTTASHVEEPATATATVAEAGAPETGEGEAAQPIETTPSAGGETAGEETSPVAEQPAAPTATAEAGPGEPQAPETGEQPPETESAPSAVAPSSSSGLPSFVQGMLDDPAKLALPAGGAVVALLGIWALLRRRRRGEGGGADPESILIDQERVPDTELLTDGAEAPLTNSANETSFLSDFSPSEIDALQEETGEVDPLSEADVYIAYGRYQQAEDLIRDALQRNPDRAALKFKLLEIHYATRDAAAFTALAESMASDGSGPENGEGWKRVLSMGKMLNPGHPLFKDAPDLDEEESASAFDDPLRDTSLGGAAIAGAAAGITAAAGGSNVVSMDTASRSVADDKTRDRDEAPAAETSEASSSSESPDGDDSLYLDLDALADEDDAKPSSVVSKVADDDFADLMDEDSIVIDLPGDLSALGEEDSILKASGLHDSILGDADDEEKPFSLDDVDDSSLILDEDSLLKGLDLPTADDQESLTTGDSAVDSTLSTLSEFGSVGGLDVDKLDDTSLSPASEMLELDSVIDDDYDEIDEVNTKLDLARAYLEMGDKDGARGILDEVMEEGDDQQKETAQKIIAELG